MGGHGVVGHASPGVVLGSGLGVPHITSVPSQVTGLESICNCIGLTDLASGCVDQVGALGHLGNHILVEQVLCTLNSSVLCLSPSDLYSTGAHCSTSDYRMNWCKGHVMHSLCFRSFRFKSYHLTELTRPCNCMTCIVHGFVKGYASN